MHRISAAAVGLAFAAAVAAHAPSAHAQSARKTESATLNTEPVQITGIQRIIEERAGMKAGQHLYRVELDFALSPGAQAGESLVEIEATLPDGKMKSAQARFSGAVRQTELKLAGVPDRVKVKTIKVKIRSRGTSESGGEETWANERTFKADAIEFVER